MNLAQRLMIRCGSRPRSVVLTHTIVAALHSIGWTESKYNKKLYFRQIGEWYVHDKCIGNTVESILGGDGGKAARGSLVPACCSAEGLFSCHYRGEHRSDHDDVLVDAMTFVGTSIKFLSLTFYYPFVLQY
jgi:hypothetical protein